MINLKKDSCDTTVPHILDLKRTTNRKPSDCEYAERDVYLSGHKFIGYKHLYKYWFLKNGLPPPPYKLPDWGPWWR